MAGIPLFTGPQDPSQLYNDLNQIINASNGFFNGQTPSPVPVTKGSTSANLPNYGLVTLGSTVAGAAYVINAPLAGVEVALVSISTKSQTVKVAGGGTYNNGNTTLTFKTTRGAGGAEVWQAATLVGLSTSAYAIVGADGSIKST